MRTLYEPVLHHHFFLRCIGLGSIFKAYKFLRATDRRTPSSTPANAPGGQAVVRPARIRDPQPPTAPTPTLTQPPTAAPTASSHPSIGTELINFNRARPWRSPLPKGPICLDTRALPREPSYSQRFPTLSLSGVDAAGYSCDSSAQPYGQRYTELRAGFVVRLALSREPAAWLAGLPAGRSAVQFLVQQELDRKSVV